MIGWIRSLLGVAPASPEPIAELEPRAAEPAREIGFVEAAGVTVDDDEDGWRRLTGDTARGLGGLTQTRQQDLAVYLWRANVIGNRLIELPVAYLLARGVTVTVKDEDAQRWIDAFWRDPINNMNIKLPKKVRELAIYGEQCWPVFVNEITGDVRLGYLDPGQIETVVTDPGNVEQPIGIVTRRNAKGISRRYRIIVNGPETVFAETAQEIRETFTDGDCFYFRVNDLSNAVRGHSDLLAVMDWIDAFDQAMFNEIERWNATRAHFFDVTLKGATQDEVEARAKTITAPKPGNVRVHNEAETWEAKAPTLGSYEASNSARLFKGHIISGRTLPEHWFGTGGDVNRATAGEMDEPTFMVLTERQTYLGYVLSEICTYVIRMKMRTTLGIELEQWPDPEDLMPVAEWPEMVTADTTAYATALQQVVIGAGVALDRGLLAEETAVSIIASIAERLGVAIDAAEELVKVQGDRTRQAERDGFANIPEDDDAADAAA